jgi:MFS family permease
MTTTTSSLMRERAAGAARGRWLMLIVLLAGQFMALLDVTIVNVAMPTIGRTLHATGAELQLVVAGYTVSYAMALITGARMGDLFGRRRMSSSASSSLPSRRWPAASRLGSRSSSPPGSSRARGRRR